MDDFFSMIITMRLFDILEKQPERLRFNWFKMNGPNDYYRGHLLQSMSVASPTMVPIELAQQAEKIFELLEQNLILVEQNLILVERIHTVINQITDDFIDTMNERYGFIGWEVGIYKLAMTPRLYDLETLEPRSRVIYRIATYIDAEAASLHKKQRCGKPKKFNIHKKPLD